MERMEDIPTPKLDLSRLRFLIDSKTVGSTKNTRTSNILTYLYEISQDSVTPEDPLYSLTDYFPTVEELPLWVKDNESAIDHLKMQNARDRKTDRYDLDEGTAKFSESAWLHTSHEACRIMSLNPELERANIALKLLYLAAHNDRLDDLHNVQRSALQPPANPAA